MITADWETFNKCVLMHINTAISDYKEKIIKKRRYYKQDIDAPIYVDTIIYCRSEWLWNNQNDRGFQNFESEWKALQAKLKHKDYVFTFSKSPEDNYGYETLWIKIKSSI